MLTSHRLLKHLEAIYFMIICSKVIFLKIAPAGGANLESFLVFVYFISLK